MGAVKKHFQKFLAAFLCVGLLLSYNPAFGAVDSAFADETASGQNGHLKNDMPAQEDLDKAVEASANADASKHEWPSNIGGEAITEVHVSTFNSTLQTARCDSFSATVDQLTGGSASGKNVSYLWYEVTGGMPSEGEDPYNATWTAYVNDEPDAAINAWMKNHPIKPEVKDNVANYHLDIKGIAGAGLLLPNKKYTFVGIFEDAAGTKAIERVTVYTANDNLVNFQHKVIKGENELKGVEIEGMINTNPSLPTLAGGTVPNTNPIKEAMEEKAAKDTMGESDDENDGNYVVKDVLQINTNPMYIDGGGGLNIPPFDEDGFILRLPVDPDSGYKAGDTVTVLWSGDDSGTIVELKDISVRDVPGEPGKLQVEIPYPYSADENNDGVDDTGWPPLPGYFAIQYDTNKSSGGGSGSGNGKAEYFTITASATGNGTVTPEGTKVWRVNANAAAGDAGLTDTSALAKAVYGFSPMGMGDKAYELTGLTLKCESGSTFVTRPLNLLNKTDLDEVGTLSTLNTTLTLNNDKSVFAPNSVWTLTATFGPSTVSGDGAKVTHKLSVKSEKPEYGKIAVAYYNENHELAMEPSGTNGNTEPVGSISGLDVLNTSKATIVMVPASSTSDKYYQVTGISMRVEGETELQPQALTKPFVVPATTKDVEVVVSFGEFTKVPGWGGEDNYTVSATVADEDAELGSVMKTVDDELVAADEYTVEYGENSTFVPNLMFQGADENTYLSSVDVYIGDRPEPERVLVNPQTNPRYTLILPNYHANLRVVGHFTDKKASNTVLSINVRTEGNPNNTAGGSFSPLAWTLPPDGKVRDNQRCPLLITPNDGYELAGVTETVGDRSPQPLSVSATLGNTWNYRVPVDEREDKSEPRRIVLTITFKKTNNGDVDPATKPPVRVNTYVADATLTNDDFNLGYAFTPETGKFFVNGVAADAGTANLSPATPFAYSSKSGTVNGRVSTFDTVKYGSNHLLNLKGGTMGDKPYGIQKLLVVKYSFVTENGVQVKKGISWNLYNTNMPVFELTNITTHTDVIAYFAEVGDGSGNTVLDNGFGDDDYCTVTVNSTPENLVWPSTGPDGVQVLKGSGLPVKFTMSNAEYVINGATENARDILPHLKDSAGSASTVSYTVSNVTGPTTVTATYEQKPEGQIKRHGVSANILVKGIDDDEAKPLEQGASQPARVSVLFGSGYTQNAQLENGTVPGVRLTEGTDLRFAISRTSSYNQLTNLAFTWSDETVKAYIVKKTADGVDQNTIYFTNDDADLVGRQLYTSGTALYGTGEGEGPANVRTEQSWYVSNLLCDITVVPTYKKLPRPEAPDTGDNWILTTLVGSGFGQVLVNDADATGCMTKVPKTGEDIVTSTNSLKVSFEPAAGYRIKELHIDTSTGNLLRDFWAWVQGFADHWFGDDTVNKMTQRAIENKGLTLQRMDSNYTITVDYEPIPEQVSPGTTLTDHVAVNVMYDSDKGSVTPDTGLVASSKAQQQFTVRPAFEMDEDDNQMFYSVTRVRVCFGDDIVDEVDAGDTTSNVVRWNSKYDNVFVVDFSKLTWPADQPDAAITVEVLFSDEAHLPQTDGAGEGDVPGTPKGDAVKRLTVNMVTDGEAEAGSNGIGGIVSPLGTTELVPSDDGYTYKQRVDVLPGDDYEFVRLDVMLNGSDIAGNPRWYDYMYMLNEDKAGYFEVAADEPGTEVITVYFRLKDPDERSYTISMGANVPDADRFIQPVGATTLLNTQSQTYSIDPDLNYWVASITDEGFDADGNKVELPEDADGKQGANWTRTEGDEQAINEVTIKPIRVHGKALNRRVVVTFERKDGVDHGIVKSEKVNLHVDVYGPGKEYVTFDPAGDMLGVFKGTDKKHVSYTYSYSLSQEGIDAGYGIYRVTVNGETVFGSPDNRTDIVYAGSFMFENDDLTRETNNLYVFVRKAKADEPGSGEEPPGTGDKPGTGDEPGNTPGDTPGNTPGNTPGDTPGNTPGDTPGNTPGNNKYVTVDYGCGNGGTITDKNPSARAARAAADEGTGGQLAGSLQVDPEEAFVLLITPKEGYVVDKLIMDNCYVIDRLWTAPDDDRDAPIALEATMMVDRTSEPARVLATFTRGDANAFKPWDPTLETGHAFTVDDSFEVEISPAAGVEALIEFENDDVRAADILDVSNPVAPFTPKATKKLNEAEDSASYTVTYDTISKLSDAKNVRIVVGPLINWNENDNEKSKLYAVDTVDGLKDVTITEQPLPNATELEEGVTDQQPYYTYYEIRGELDENAPTVRNVAGAEEGANSDAVALAANAVPKVRIGLRSLSLNDGVFPEYMTLSDIQSVQLRALVVSGKGSILPTAVTVGTSWFNGDLTGPWRVAPGSTVAFKVEADDGYVLTGLSYDSLDALRNGAYDADTHTLMFRASISTAIYAEFTPKEAALRTVTIEVVPSKDGAIHGSTSPAPGVHKVEKGQPYAVTFKANDGYIPYLIWVDDQGSYVSPTLSGWMLPAWWSDQTFKVQYEPVGTTHGWLDDVKLGLDNGTRLVQTGLVQTGDNPWLPVIVLLALLAGGAAFFGMRMKRASEAATRAAKYSVTRRAAPSRREEHVESNASASADAEGHDE